MAEHDDQEKRIAETVRLISSWFLGKTKEEIKAIDHGDRLLWPEKIRRRGHDGGVIERPCMLRVPNVNEKAQSIVLANEHAAKLAKVKQGERFTRDQAITYIGFDAYSEFETVALLSFAIREPTAPHAQMYMFPLIADAVLMSSLYEIYDRLDFYSHLEDVRVDDLTEDMFWALVENVAKVANLSPLVGIAGSMRDRFIIGMARLLVSQSPKRSSQSSKTSTPEPSTATGAP